MGQVLTLAQSPPPPQRIIFGSALIRRLIDHAACLTGLPTQTITGCGKLRDAVWTRWAISIVARENGRTLHQIAECFNRDHTTVINGLREGGKLTDREFGRLVDLLREEASR